MTPTLANLTNEFKLTSLRDPFNGVKIIGKKNVMM